MSSSTWQYDAAGDVHYDARNTYLYDAEGRICAVNNGSANYGYDYDAEGHRVAVGTINALSCNRGSNGFSPIREYVVGLSGEQLTELGSGNAWTHTNVFAAGQLLATYSGSDTYFALHDWLGSKRAEFGVSGCTTTYGSLPFGDEIDTFNPTADPCPMDATEHHYTGKERDGESGNDYFGARYYASSMGRWLPILRWRAKS